jgi:hypothetical protein
MTTITDQKLPDGYHWHAQDGTTLPAPDADCGLHPFDRANDGPRPPAALPCVGAKVLALPERERS